MGGTHAVFMRSSEGMDVKLVGDGGSGGLEYNMIGGVVDMYFLAGSETEPAAAARQYAEVVGMPAEVPYWSFGLHQCRFGYKSRFKFEVMLLVILTFFFLFLIAYFIDVANVITNYSAAKIPLETMWTDIGADWLRNSP